MPAMRSAVADPERHCATCAQQREDSWQAEARSDITGSDPDLVPPHQRP